MKNNISAWIVGFVFALGLGISGMTDPKKVIGFLNVFGNWDPSLIFVMMGSIAVHFVTYRWIRRRSLPLFSNQWHVPQKSQITPSLMIGSLIFGIGWGLAGYCPGPALTSLAFFQLPPFVFVASMLAGMFLFKLVDQKLSFNR